MVKTLNELLADRNSLEETRQKLLVEKERIISDVESKIDDLNDVIKSYFSGGSSIGIASQLVYVTDNGSSVSERIETIEKFRDLILDGKAQCLIDEKNAVRYYYNSGFGDGHARIIQRNMSENYAVEHYGIEFKNNIYDEGYILTDDDVIALIAFTDKQLEKENEH